MSNDFNLSKQPWISCIDMQGTPVELSLCDTFRQAHELTAVETDNPLTTAVLHRLLLVVLHRALDGPANEEDWLALWQAGNFSETPVQDYLETWQSRFNLFDPDYPFYQTADFTLQGDNSFVPVNKLFHERAAANNKTLFDHTLDHEPPALTPAQAARALVTLQMYALGGGQGPTSLTFAKKHPNFANAPLIGGMVALLQGRNLFETLMLNLLTWDSLEQAALPYDDDDLPVWEQDTPRPPGTYPPHGLLEYLTWRSRHIRLLPDTVDDKTRVRYCYLAQADSLMQPPPVDPMFARRKNKDGELFPLKLSTERAFWRDSASLFEFSESGGDDNRPLAIKQLAGLIDDSPEDFASFKQHHLPCTVIGLANDKANPLAWRQEFVSVPDTLLKNPKMSLTLRTALKIAEEDIGLSFRYKLRDMATAILANTLEKNAKPDAKAVSAMVESMGAEARYWSEMELLYYDFLNRLTPDADLEQWRQDARQIAINILKETAQKYLSARELRAAVTAVSSFRRITAPKKLPQQETAHVDG